jgi:hypothetical protein
MASPSAAKQKTKLPPGEYDVLKALIDLGGDKVKVGTADLDKKSLNAVKARKGFLEVDEVKQGRGTSVTSAKVLVKLEDFERAANRAPRGGGSGGGRPVRAPARGGEMGALRKVFSDHGKVRAYLDAVNSNSQREWEKRRQEGLTDVELAKATKGLRGQALQKKTHEFFEAQNQTFEDYLRSLGFESIMIEVLGVPDVGPDTPDQRRARA